VNLKVRTLFALLSLLVLLVNFVDEALGQQNSDGSVAVYGTIRIEKSLDRNGKISLPERNLNGGIVLFRDEKNKEFIAKGNEKGKYKITLPFGKYFVYATVNDRCWMCAEFYHNDFVVVKKGRIKLDVFLRFTGEGRLNIFMRCENIGELN
jgi:hypothetical protein